MHSLELQALSSHHGRKMLNSGVLQLLIRRPALGPQQRDRGHGPSCDQGGAGSIQLEMGEPRFISQDAQKVMRQTLLWAVFKDSQVSDSPSLIPRVSESHAVPPVHLLKQVQSSVSCDSKKPWLRCSESQEFVLRVTQQ